MSDTDFVVNKGLVEEELRKFGKEQPEMIAAFQNLHKQAIHPNALEKKTKELIALAISVAVRCDDCIAFHTSDALKAGASEEEIMEALSVAVFMGGGPALVYAAHAVSALQQFSNLESS